MTSVFAETVKEFEDAVFIVIFRIARVKNPQKEVLDKDPDRLFKVFSEVQE